MSATRFLFAALLALVITTRAEPVLAQVLNANHEGGGLETARPHRAVVVLVGAAALEPALRELLMELLERQGVICEVSTQSGFEERELLRDLPHDQAVHVFIVFGAHDHAQLYFRGPAADRFLLRSARLGNGFDELGRELIGQIVETAVTLLLTPGGGLTREQAQLALDSGVAAADVTESAHASASPGEARRVAAAKINPTPPQKDARPVVLEGWLGARWGAAQLGAPLGFAHGPGLELGLGVKRGWVMRARVSGERGVDQTFATAAIAARIATTRLMLAGEAGVTLAVGHVLLASVGVGRDRADVTPRARNGSLVVPAAAFENTAPIARAELRYEAGSGMFRVAAAVGADTSFLTTHYDVTRGAASESVVEPWTVRPQGSLALVLCPQLATY